MERLYLTEKISYADFLCMGKDVYLYPGRFLAFFNSRPFIKAIFEDKQRYPKYQELKKQNVIDDVFLFKMSYILNPYMALRYHHFIFKSYQELGKAMLSYGPIVDIYLKDLLIYHLLSFYMEQVGDDKMNPREYKYVLKAEKEAENDENCAYWKLAFLLSGTKVLTYEGKEYTSPEAFFSEHMMISDLFRFSSSFLNDKCVLSWLKLLGYQEKVDSFLSLASVSDKKDEEANDRLAKELYSKFITLKS